MAINRAVIIGNLVRPPESRVTDNGTHICKFTVAVNRMKDRNGQSQADYIPVKTLGNRADVCAKYLDKGSKVGVEGTLSTYTYNAQDGSKRFVMEILADKVDFLSSTSQGTATSALSSETDNPEEFTEVDDDELPF